MTTQTPERQDGLKALEVAIEKVQEVIKSLGGVFNVQMGVSNLKYLMCRHV
jgi:translation initiation factor 2 subunit 1